MKITQNAALVVVDVQKGFDESEFWGPRNNPAADENIASLIAAWQNTDRPVVFVRHDSNNPGSPLRTGYQGNDFKDYVEERRGKGGGSELLVTKSVNSAFYGTLTLTTGSRRRASPRSYWPVSRPTCAWRPPPAWAATSVTTCWSPSTPPIPST